MTLEKTAKYLKIVKYTLYKIARKGKISAVKIEPGRNNKVVMRIPYNQELIKKIKTISERKWNPEGKYREVSDDVMPLQKELFIRKYSRKIIKSYAQYNRDFLLFVGEKPDEIENEDIKSIFNYMTEREKVTIAPLNIVITL